MSRSGRWVAAILLAGTRGCVTADNAEEGFRLVTEITGLEPDPAGFHAALAEAVAAGLVAEPLRLPDGALHCVWRLDLTPAGVARARLLAAPEPLPPRPPAPDTIGS